jgi:hypothetical protein
VTDEIRAFDRVRQEWWTVLFVHVWPATWAEHMTLSKRGCLDGISNIASSGQSASPFLISQACFPWLPWHDLESCHILAGAVQPAGGAVGRNKPPAGGQPVPLSYSNPYIVYADAFPALHFEQGCSCFAAALDAVYFAVNLVAIGCRTHA